MPNLRRHLLVFCLALLAPPASAISLLALSSLAQQGKHHELIAALAPDVAAGRDVSSFRLMLLGGAYYEVGKYREAGETADLLEQRIEAGDATQFGADLSVYPEILRATVALDQGLHGEAIGHGETALARLKSGHFFHRSQLIQISGSLGVAHALSGEADAARRDLERIRAVDLAKSNLGPEKFTAMARIQLALRDYAGALASIGDREAAVSPTLLAHYDPTFQDLPRFFIRAKSLYETGQVAAAKRAYDELLRHPQIGQFGTLYWIVLYDRARIAAEEDNAGGDAAGAIEWLRRALEIIESRRSGIASEAGRIGFVGDKQAVYGLLVELLLRRNRAAEALEVVERAKSRALVDLLAAKTDFAARGGAPERVRRALAEIDAIDRAASEKAAPNQEAVAGSRTLSIVSEQLAQTEPELATLVAVAAIPATDLAALLPAGETLVEYYQAGPALHAFVLKQGRVRAVRLDASGLEADVQALRAAMERPGDTAWEDLAERLHARLWRPLRDLVGDSRRVLIVPHGVLHYLPFAALRGGEGQPLLERHAMRFLPSASVLRFLRAPSATGGGLLSLGNPDLGDPRLDLKFAAEEAEAVSRLFPDARLLTRGEASETRFRALAPAFRRLHVASHGKFRAGAPLASGLYLARDAENDGVLSVGELYALRLNADLVALSACETGLGKVVNGDDVVGLNRGFLYAGARAIVASLWRVDDRATAHLMRGFYRNLATMDKVEALRQAQLASRREYPHPFYWAAFQLTGRGD